MLIDDDQDLRAGLRALAGGALPPATELAARSVGRHRAVRRRRAGVAAGVVVAALVAAVPLTAPLRAPEPPPTLATSLLSWPDLRDPRWTAAADVALADYPAPGIRVVPDLPVHWLYAGLVPGTDAVAAAWAYCSPVACSRVVLAQALREHALTPEDDGLSHWVTQEADVVDGAPAAPLSTYLFGERESGGPSTVVLAVVPPGTRSVAWSAPALRPGTGGSGTLAAAGGVYVGDIGYLSAPARLAVSGAAGYEGRVGVPGDTDRPLVGSAPRIDAPRVPAPFEQTISTRGQINDGADHFIDGTPGGTRLALYARCLGTAPVDVTYRGTRHRVPCDGAARAVLVDAPVRGEVMLDFAATDPYTSLSWALGYRS